MRGAYVCGVCALAWWGGSYSGAMHRHSLCVHACRRWWQLVARDAQALTDGGASGVRCTGAPGRPLSQVALSSLIHHTALHPPPRREAELCLQNLNVPHFHHDFVARWGGCLAVL